MKDFQVEQEKILKVIRDLQNTKSDLCFQMFDKAETIAAWIRESSDPDPYRSFAEVMDEVWHWRFQKTLLAVNDCVDQLRALSDYSRIEHMVQGKIGVPKDDDPVWTAVRTTQTWSWIANLEEEKGKLERLLSNHAAPKA